MALFNHFLLLTLCSLLLSVNSTTTSSNLTATEISAIFAAIDSNYAVSGDHALMIQYMEYAVRGALQAIDGNEWDMFTVTGSPAAGDIACAG